MTRERSFASVADNLPAGLPGHDEELSGDILTTLIINFEWRRLISDALQSYADSIIRNLDDALVDDYRNKFQALINDLYTPEGTVDTPLAVHVARTTNQAIAANIAENVSWNSQISEYPTSIWDISDPEDFNIPPDGEGWWLLTGIVTFTQVGTGFRSVQILVDGVSVFFTNELTSGTARISFAHSFFLSGSEVIRISVQSDNTHNVTGGATQTTCSLVRIYGQR